MLRGMELSAIKSNCLQCYTVKLFVHFVTVCLKAQKWTQIDTKVQNSDKELNRQGTFNRTNESADC